MWSGGRGRAERGVRVADRGSPRAGQGTREGEEVSWERANLQCLDAYLWSAGETERKERERACHSIFLGAGIAREREVRGEAKLCSASGVVQ